VDALIIGSIDPAAAPPAARDSGGKRAAKGRG
jgi:hypothetical protein